MKTIIENENNIPQRKANLGRMYYKQYYEGLFVHNYNFEGINRKLLDYCVDNNETTIFPLGYHKFELKTTYPGLLIGSGLIHEAGRIEAKELKKESNELKLGMSFDYTTGLPILPASSIKGVLRSVFPFSINKASNMEEERKLEESYREPRRKYLQKILGKTIDIDMLEKIIFEGMLGEQPIPIYKRDLFFDAFISSGNVKPLGTDYITPHLTQNKKLEEPTPIKFLKILPEVKFCFSFTLRDSIEVGVSKEQKLDLFKKILLDIGIGAKTNVGYGQFT